MKLWALFVVFVAAKLQPESCANETREGRLCCCYDSHLRRLGVECYSIDYPKHECPDGENECVCYIPQF